MDSITKPTNELHSLCRTCLSKECGTRNIFTDKCSNGQSYYEVLTNCVGGITINVNSLPSYICNACATQLESFVVCNKIDDDFVAQCNESDFYLNRVENGIFIKTEVNFDTFLESSYSESNNPESTSNCLTIKRESADNLTGTTNLFRNISVEENTECNLKPHRESKIVGNTKKEGADVSILQWFLNDNSYAKLVRMRQKRAESKRRSRAKETPEQKAARRRQDTLRRKLKRAQMSAAEKEVERRKNAEYRRQRRSEMNKLKQISKPL